MQNRKENLLSESDKERIKLAILTNVASQNTNIKSLAILACDAISYINFYDDECDFLPVFMEGRKGSS